MLAGLRYLVTEVAVLLVVSAGIGLLAGRYLWPRRPRGAGAHGLAQPAPHSPAGTPASPAGSPASPAGSLHGPASVAPGDLTTAALAPSVRHDALVAELERRLQSSRAEVVKLQAEALRLKAAVSAVSDRKDAEMGRLETAAIEALDSLIASSTRRTTALEEESRVAAAAARDHELALAEERNRAARLQAALSERDARIAQLLGELTTRERRPGEAEIR